MVMVEALRVAKGVDLRPLCEQLRREGRPFRVYEAGGAQCLAVADEEAQVRVLALAGGRRNGTACAASI